jgi:hypothetical protein
MPSDIDLLDGYKCIKPTHHSLQGFGQPGKYTHITVRYPLLAYDETDTMDMQMMLVSK